MITKLLIANRGEIACRIMRTAKAMGIATVAVYSDADAKALHRRSADEAVHIGPSPAAESYLVGAKIIAAAKETGAQAIHPGYGFLSENAEFARAVIEAGLIWVGPKPESIQAMGLKDAAKARMIAAGVPVTPGYLGEDQSAERLAREAEGIGYPVLIKAVAGGGGKGMRKVDAPEDFSASLESCQREAKASFGNDEVLLEKWITSPRHIEVQVFGDSHGNVVHLFERDCSLQRRHQKVIEEAPAPGMDDATREEICAAAVRAAEAVDYVGAGTIEFIADASEGLRADRIFFMEMNTRLQVEHPVTEEITGVDLVEWQLRVASEERIPVKQEQLSINGHAIEGRLYAEDPAKGFLPSTGRLEAYNIGDFYHSSSSRIDDGVEEGSEITPYYDPMIAKIICHADTREEAINALWRSCGNTAIAPIQTNAWFLHRLLALDEFRSGAMTTGTIGAQIETLTDVPIPSPAALEGMARRLVFGDQNWDQSHHAPALDGFRLNAPKRISAIIEVSGKDYTIEGLDGDPIEGSEFLGLVDRGLYYERGQVFSFGIARFDNAGSASAADGAILAPMPGNVIAVDVSEGDQVIAGQRLMVLEAMKMEHALTAPFDGTVTALKASEGGQVQVEAVLCVVEPQE